MTTDNRKCYWSNGQSDEDHVPCSSDEYTTCCDPSDICLGNGLCLSIGEPHGPYSGSCTNAKWTNNCSEYCADPDVLSIYLYRIQDIDSRYMYCCGVPIADEDGNLSCQDGDPFSVDDSSEIMFGRALLQNIYSFNATTSTCPSNNTAASNHTTDTICEDLSNHNAKIGAGVGAPLGALMLGFLAWALIERRMRLNRTKNSPVPMTAPASDQYSTPVHPSDRFSHRNTAMYKPSEEVGQNQPVPEIMDRER
ncbi:hypothetical protein BDV59DRAFT_194738 [Aspergillus ambiguus]|uniref:uncharacterized protein n=1 Tax=Aspergillus ambiguus TaxID=176160 RepID=UPI003CCD085D